MPICFLVRESKKEVDLGVGRDRDDLGGVKIIVRIHSI